MTAAAKAPAPPPDAFFEANDAVADGMADWAKKKPKARAGGISRDSMAKAAREVDEMVRAEDWSAARGTHFVALYMFLHLRVYGVECAEMGPRDRMLAAGLASRLLERELGGDGDALAQFVRWTWARERDREKWRRANGRSGGRIGWRLQFGGQLLTEYRLDAARRGHK